MVPFAGWEMPVQYSSILEEHVAVRTQAGVFDVSHMGEIVVKGPKSRDFLEHLTCNVVASLVDGQVQYNAVLNEAGGLVDDVTIYRISADNYFVCSNASNYEAVFAHFKKFQTVGVEIENESDQWHQIALQGPAAELIFEETTGVDCSAIGYFRFRDIEFQGALLRISRTGYTGEDGFEIYSDRESGVRLWNLLLESGAAHGLKPCGLGARDTLRLEAMYPLYGHELSAEWSPVESGIGWIVKEKTPPYLGYDRIQREKREGPAFKHVPFLLLEPGVPRAEYVAYAAGAAEPAGVVLSGAYSPTLKVGIGTVRLPAALAVPEQEFEVEIRGRRFKARVQKGAFVKGGAGRK